MISRRSRNSLQAMAAVSGPMVNRSPMHDQADRGPIEALDQRHVGKQRGVAGVVDRACPSAWMTNPGRVTHGHRLAVLDDRRAVEGRRPWCSARPPARSRRRCSSARAPAPPGRSRTCRSRTGPRRWRRTSCARRTVSPRWSSWPWVSDDRVDLVDPVLVASGKGRVAGPERVDQDALRRGLQMKGRVAEPGELHGCRSASGTMADQWPCDGRPARHARRLPCGTTGA